MDYGVTNQTVTTIIKVRYYSETTGQFSGREYSYYSEEHLNVGDIVTVPVRDSTGKAQVSAVDVPESEIEAFKDKVKTIPAGAKCIITTAPLGPLGGVTGIVSPAGHVTILPKVEETVGVPNRSVPNETEAVIRVDPGACLAPTETTSIKIKPETDVQAQSLYNEGLKLQRYAESRVIACDQDVKLATDDLSMLAKLKKALDGKRKEYLGPVNFYKNAITEAFRNMVAPFDIADTVTRKKIMDYRAECERKAREIAEINRMREEAAAREANLNGTGEISEPLIIIEVPPVPATTVRTESGTLGTMKIWKFEVTDITKVPAKYLLVNEALVGKLVRAGERDIPGVRIYSEETLKVNAR